MYIYINIRIDCNDHQILYLTIMKINNIRRQIKRYVFINIIYRIWPIQLITN